ncbi:MAG: endonuclease MutS2 [Gemmatimonadota bacterium]|nr:endonuclease MutS2 [Gemmatimonadota bacterium]
MNRHAWEVLEFAEALELVAGYAASGLGGDAVRALQPRSTLGAVRDELAVVAEGMALSTREGGWRMPTFPDLRAPLSRLGLEGYAWDGPTLRLAATLILAARTTRLLISPLAGDLPGLASAAEPLQAFPGLAEQVDRAIAEDGSVRDSASPALGKIRRELQGARARIVSKLSEYVAALPQHFQVPDGSVSIRDGRYVIPVRREGRGEVGGIIHGESQTGATLFVEPPAAIEMMNRLRELEAEEGREIQRILLETTDRLRPHAGELSASLTALVRLDTIHARARYAIDVNGHAPEVLPSGYGLEVVQGRHPILFARGEPVVPFDLRMDDSERTLVISGPNTGGKTVLLKAIGLIALLTRTGVVPPVGPGSRIPLFSDVFADIGDEQSIEASLSTFSAHLRNLRETLAGADSESLVLIDEIGSGTDPVEGAALSLAIIRELTARSCFSVVTTHLGALKLLAAEDPRVVNASLRFDAEQLRPTYLLQKGIPGRSHGLAIARRLGLPAELLDQAEAALPNGERDIARLLLELEAKEQQTTALRTELDREQRVLQELARKLEEREREMTRREKDAERRAREQARDLLLHSRAEVEAAIRQVREAGDEAALATAAKDARRRVEEAARRQREKAPVAASGRRAPRAEELRVGLRVRIESLGKTGTVLELRARDAMVDAGGLRIRLPLDDLTPLPAGDQAASNAPRAIRPAGGRIDADLDARPEVDLRGMRPGDLALHLGRALDTAIMAGLPSFRIIHGKGTGALRAEVEELLRADPRIITFRPGERFEGGTGVTVVEFS